MGLRRGKEETAGDLSFGEKPSEIVSSGSSGSVSEEELLRGLEVSGRGDEGSKPAMGGARGLEGGEEEAAPPS
ncbi:MAG: hypothetical protein IT584_02010 [Chlamydiae bacterium]|nr:hypothetical protein [Chlamydiota bacterium]